MSLTLLEARRRAELIHDVDTVLHLDLTSTDRYALEATITFGCREAGATSFLELSDAQDLTVTGATYSYDGTRITLTDLAAENSVTVRASMPYVTDGDGMTPVTDPADGERYVSAYTAMDIARRVIPCFDQPDIKTSFTLSVTAPSHWTVLANGKLDHREGDTWFFHKTPRFSSYIFFMCGGPFVSRTWTQPYAPAEGGTLDFGWHARASQEPALTREFDRLRDITSRAFAFYTETFDEPYAFADYQQVFTPGLNWGAMEFPGCVAFRDEYLTPAEPTAMEQHAMNSVIAHEMAHMWFGDLVTMRWWEDSWLNESFADFMGYEVSGRVTGASAWTAAATGRKPSAYRADSRRSTHRIAEDPENLPDVDTAFANFDMITYAKGNSVLRQLVTWLGEEDFIAGVNAHLSAHPFGNATLADFLDALSSATDRDVRSWADVWLRTTGYDTIRLTTTDGVPMLHRDGVRPHRTTVHGYDTTGALVRTQLVDIADAPVALDDFAGLIVLPNALDETYAAISLDADAQSALDGILGAIENTLTRAFLWATAAMQVERGERSVASLVELARTQLAIEQDATVFEGIMTRIYQVVIAYSTPEAIGAHFAALAEVAAAVLASDNPTTRTAAQQLFGLTSTDVSALRAALDSNDDQALRWIFVHRLASLGHPDAIATEAERDRTNSGAQAALKATAAIPTADAKSASWEQLTSGTLSNREFSAVATGFWNPQQSEVLAPWVLRAPQELSELARRSGQAMGQLIGRALPVIPLSDETLDGFIAALRTAIAGDLPTVAARGFNDQLDDVERVRAARTSL